MKKKSKRGTRKFWEDQEWRLAVKKMKAKPKWKYQSVNTIPQQLQRSLMNHVEQAIQHAIWLEFNRPGRDSILNTMANNKEFIFKVGQAMKEHLNGRI